MRQPNRILRNAAAFSVLAAALGSTAHAAEPRPSPDELRARYERAAAWQDYEAKRYVLNADVFPFWIGGSEEFWYKRQTEKGNRFVVFDAAKGTREEAFDHAKLAARLAKATGKEVDAEDLPIFGLSLTLTPRTAAFTALGKSWTYDAATDALAEDTGTTRDRKSLLISPDGSKALFLKEYNLWVRDLKSGAEKALTSDGVRYYAYAGVPDATGRPAARPEAVWSPDSAKVFTAQVDDRQVKDLPMIDYAPKDGSVRPTASAVRTALPGDEHVTGFRLLVIDAATGKQVAAHYPAIPAVRMNDTPFGGGRAWWSADGKTAYVVEIERGERTARVVAIDAASGETRTVLEEKAERYLELGSNVYMPASIVPLPATDELVWYSERSGWAHLYLYDLATGALKRQLTAGEWLVRDVVALDAPRRELYVTLAGRVPGRHPYYREAAKVNLDTGGLTVLSSFDADHKLRSQRDLDAFMLALLGEDTELLSALSPSRTFLVETVTRADGPARTVVLRRDGSEAAVVETADASRVPKGWTWPEPVLLKAADGTTDIAAVVFRPPDFSPDRRYPLIDCIYGGPQVSNVPESFGISGSTSYLDAVSLAELGFVTVIVDGRGTTERDRAFHEASWGAAHTASNLEDHVAAIRQLGDRFPYLDLERVGITGFSGGGYMTAVAMMRYPDFFKVGVAGAGNYDQRLFWHTWGERYQGPLEDDSYLPQAALTYARDLKGKLMFVHGLADAGCHPAGLFQLTQALIDAEKDFDLTLQPRAAHELGGWAQRRQWDYFVRNLAGLEPPPPVAHTSASDIMKAKLMASLGLGEEPKKQPAPAEEGKDEAKK
jgi:dipeptidyl aminopeptidase/acylaminoacyl peptidase